MGPKFTNSIHEEGTLKVDVLFDVPNKHPRGRMVVVDVLRSSSAIIEALANGARAVIPFSDLRKTIEYRHAPLRGGVVLVGERDGIKPRGFDYNISPLAMSRRNVQGKTILYSSTNLTRVLRSLGESDGTLIGSLSNARAVAKYLAKANRDVNVIVCGDLKGPTIEDLIGAGAIVSHLPTACLSDQAMCAVGLYGNRRWRSWVKKGRITRRLLELGLQKDVDFCLTPDRSSVVPGVRGNRILNLNT